MGYIRSSNSGWLNKGYIAIYSERCTDSSDISSFETRFEIKIFRLGLERERYYYQFFYYYKSFLNLNLKKSYIAHTHSGFQLEQPTALLPGLPRDNINACL